jgi:hypothetical protein
MINQDIEVENIICDTLAQNKRLMSLLSSEDKIELIDHIKVRVFKNWDQGKSPLEKRIPFIARQEGYAAYNRRLAKKNNIPIISLTIAREAIRKSRTSDSEIDQLRRDKNNECRCSIENVKKAIEIIREVEHGGLE